VNRIWLGVGVAAALLIALVVALATGSNSTATNTTAVAIATTTAATPTTTTTAAPTTTTTAPPTTTTTEEPSTTTALSLEEREAEVLALVGELELRMYRAVWGGDVEELADLVAAELLFDALVATALEPEAVFTNEPTTDTYKVELYEIKLDRPDCLVVDVTEDGTAFRVDGGEEDLILVLWPFEDAELGWRLAARYGGGTPESSWLPECDLQDREWRP